MFFALIVLFALLGVFENPIAFGFVILSLCIYLYYTKKFVRHQWLLLIMMLILAIGVGALAKGTQKTQLTGEETSLILSVRDHVKINGNRLSAITEISRNGERVVLNYRIRSPEEKDQLRNAIYPGIVCKVSGELLEPTQSRNPNAFDYRAYLQRKDIFWNYEATRIDLDLCTEVKGNLVSQLKRVRQMEINKLEDKLNEGTAAISAALLFGDRNLMAPEILNAYEKTGTVHLLAISGLHVALLAGMCYSLLLRIGLTREKVDLILIISLPLYAVLTGLTPSVNRAVSMLMFFIIARKLRLKVSPLDVFSLAFLFLVLTSPFIIYEPGFQLSFCVSLALILSASGIIGRYDSYLSKLAVVSMIAQLASVPVILSFFYEISLISVMANLLFVPLFSLVILPIVLISYLTSIFFPPSSELFLPLVEFFVTFANQMSAALAGLPISSVIIGKPGISLVLFQLVFLLVTFVIWEKSGKVDRPSRVPLFCLLPMIPILFQLVLPYLSPVGKVVFIDVGQGDSIFIQLPFNRANYLIDTGGTIAFPKEEWEERRDKFEVGEDILLPYLKSEGVRKIDKLVLTHGDMDHIGGASSLLSGVKVKEILLPVAKDRSDLERNIIKKAQSKQIKIIEVGAGSGWKEGDNVFHVISPFEKLDDKNEGSIVLWARFGGKTWLFTGDIGESSEEELVKRFPEMQADVLKVGHHGSKTSSSEIFLESISIDTAVISAGVKNRYGHPHQEVLDRLKNHQVNLYRTDQQGAIIYIFTAESGTFSSWIP
ncbi:competence protein ComEC [Mesobacillus persicus]|uniref:Competence protein ComEC n=1 Tax=Mesobacillus persicus TaxID=930146 RepID=A0A1H7X9E7_9BACI|nr:DNA internalization-related competence protein ComEC/Rec2 [Mesobacillus persicus]SEM30512.1 competence protein ComEC [Mesobacillus persicus]